MPKGKIILVLLGTYTLCVALVCFFWDYLALLTGCYVIISVILLVRWHAASDVIFFFVAFILGPVGEFFATLFGAWTYAQPFYYIPTWLPFLWGIAALVVKKISEALLVGTDHLNNKK